MIKSLIEKISGEIPYIENIGYPVFWSWYEDNQNIIEELYINETDENDMFNLAPNDRLACEANKIYLGFQVFYILFKTKNIQTISIKKLFLDIKHVLVKYLKNISIELTEIQDESHQKDLFEMFKMIKEKYYDVNNIYTDEFQQMVEQQKFIPYYASEKVTSTDIVFNYISCDLAAKFPLINSFLNRRASTQIIKVQIVRFFIKISNRI